MDAACGLRRRAEFYGSFYRPTNMPSPWRCGVRCFWGHGTGLPPVSFESGWEGTAYAELGQSSMSLQIRGRDVMLGDLMRYVSSARWGVRWYDMVRTARTPQTHQWNSGTVEQKCGSETWTKRKWDFRCSYGMVYPMYKEPQTVKSCRFPSSCGNQCAPERQALDEIKPTPQLADSLS